MSFNIWIPRPVYIESCACVVKDTVKCSFECLSVVHHTCRIHSVGVGDGEMIKKQRTNGPVNAHLISWPSKAQNIQNLENIWVRNDLDLQYSHTFINSISCLHLPTFRSLAAIVSEKSTVFTFSHRKT